MGSTLIFSCISWLGPFLVQNFEFQYFWKFQKKKKKYFFIQFFFLGGGARRFCGYIWGHCKIGLFEGVISMQFSSVLNIYGKSAHLSLA